MMRELELLAPAKNLECGRAAIEHGADAVYIGASRFGARAAVGNSVDDIRQLCDYAHQYCAKVYVTVNTILYDDELESTRQLLSDLADARVDAILVQDMALLQMPRLLSQIPAIHASTQTDNRTPDKVRWLHDQGFSRVVLARELSLDEIAAIHHEVPDVELEVFVHGALCVSYSGLCYASQHCFNRSANRGECAQFCRMKFDLTDADGRVLERGRHLLSLKDLNQSDHLEQLALAGATSFKIEGRLKDIDYVKNVTAAYSQRLDDIVRRHPDTYRRASLGTCRYTFTPQLDKTFNRGYTTYFLHGRQPDIASFDTPKAVGEFVGTVKELRRDSFNVAGTAVFANGDGLCFFNDARQLEGFRVNKAVGNRLYPQHIPANLRPGQRLYRNSDQEFERLLSRPSAVRKIPVTMQLTAFTDADATTGFQLRLDDGFRPPVVTRVVSTLMPAQKPQRDNIVSQLARLGNTPFECTEVSLPDDFGYFVPSSLLATLRREAVEAALHGGVQSAPGGHEACPVPAGALSADSAQSHFSFHAPPAYSRAYLYNISNHLASQFYSDRGIAVSSSAYELKPDAGGPIMQCRHCLRYALGCCVKNGGHAPSWREPLSLRLGDGRRFRLEFDCRHCQMNVYADAGDGRDTQNPR